MSGTLVAFESDASNFVAGDTVTRDVFVKNLSTAAVIRASQTSAGVGGALPSTQPYLASNGNFVVFQTGSQLDRSNPDNNGLSDIYRHALSSGNTERATLSVSAPTNAAGSSFSASVSANGRYVWFTSTALTLTSPPAIRASQIYRRDMSNLDVLLASNGDQTAGLAQTSSDGRSACFESNAALEASDTNQVSDVWRFDVATSSLARQSLATSAVASHFGNDATNLTDVGPNASRVFGLTLARDLDTASFAAPPSFAQQLAEIEPTTAQIQLRPRNVSGALPTADVYSARQSTDGNWLAFDTLADNLSALDANTTTDVYRMNLATGVLNLVSLNTAGLGSGSATSSGSALGISGTGARVAFLSDAGNLHRKRQQQCNRRLCLGRKPKRADAKGQCGNRWRTGQWRQQRGQHGRKRQLCGVHLGRR